MRAIYQGTLKTCALLFALTYFYGCVPVDSIQVNVLAGDKSPIEFRRLLVRIIIENGFVAHKHSDEIPGDSPFRDLGSQLGATFGSSTSNRISVYVGVDRNSKKANLRITEYLLTAENQKKFSPQTVAIAEKIIKQLRQEFGSENVFLERSSSGIK